MIYEFVDADIFSPFHPFTLSPFHPFTFSPFHPFTNDAALNSLHEVSLSVRLLRQSISTKGRTSWLGKAHYF